MHEFSISDRDFLDSDFGPYKVISNYVGIFNSIAFDNHKYNKIKRKELEVLQRNIEAEMLLGELYIIEDNIDRSSENEIEEDRQFMANLRQLHTIITNYYYSLYDNKED